MDKLIIEMHSTKDDAIARRDFYEQRGFTVSAIRKYGEVSCHDKLGGQASLRVLPPDGEENVWVTVAAK